MVSIHAPREGCDGKNTEAFTGAKMFQFTHPVRGATTANGGTINFEAVSIHAPREGCDPVSLTDYGVSHVSIHAPREGCDLQPVTSPGAKLAVSIHAPREGCD